MDTDQGNEPSTAYNEFKDMILKPKLVDDFYNYGYNYPSMAQQKVIAALQNGRDVVVQEPDPGKIATICLGILQLLDFADHQLQALVLTASRSSTIKIREDMQQLGGSLGVNVCVVDGPIDSQRLDGVDVIVASSNHLLYLFRENTDVNHIKMIFFNEPDCMDTTVISSIFNKLPNKEYQFGIFAETELQGKVWRYVEPKLKQPPFFNSESKGSELSFKGIIEHQVVGFVFVSPDALIKVLQYYTHEASVVVFVNQFNTIDHLAREFLSRGYGYLQGREVLTTSKEMNQKRRDEITKQLSFKNCVLITTEEWARGIDFQMVKCVVCYDLVRYDPEKYIRCMGRFSGGRVTAINFVTRFGMNTLFEIQKQYYREVVFKVSTLVDGQAGFSPEEFPMKELPHAAPDIKHIVYDCEDRELDYWKSSMLHGIVSRCFCQTKSVVFVNTFKQIKILSKEMADSFGDGEFKVFDTLSEFSECESTCMLITTDKEELGSEPPREMPLIINFDLPLSREVYNHRIACCGEDGTVLHFVTDHDWFKVFHVQSAYKYILTESY